MAATTTWAAYSKKFRKMTQRPISLPKDCGLRLRYGRHQHDEETTRDTVGEEGVQELIRLSARLPDLAGADAEPPRQESGVDHGDEEFHRRRRTTPSQAVRSAALMTVTGWPTTMETFPLKLSGS